MSFTPLRYQNYNWLILLSLPAGVVSSFIAFYITMPGNTNRYRLLIGGFIMGSGIVAMHYAGMEAMNTPAEFSYDIHLWILSGVIAFIASYAALFLFQRFRNQPIASWLKWLLAVSMAIAVCGMQYTGMQAAKFRSHAEIMADQAPSSDFFVLYGVTITIFIILSTSWGALVFDRHVLEKLAYRNVGVLFLDPDQFKP